VSWDESFADRYEEWSAPMTADIAFHVGLARAADGPLVELAIGNGRVAIPVAQATGKPVIGIDSSATMLAKARAGAAKAGVRRRWRRCTAASPVSRSPTKATSTCSSPAIGAWNTRQ
jgi:ubiquinone/menaquinone biosynthesis C-methylase UbiE